MYVLRVHAFHSTLLLSCVAFEFSDILSLLTLEIYTTFELIHCLRACSIPKTNPGNQRVSLLSQCQNRIVGSGPKLELYRVRFWGGGLFSKNGAGGTVQKWNAKVRGRRDKGDPDVEQEFQRYIDARLYNVPRSFSAKDVVVELTENALLSESKSTAVRQKETKLNEKGRSASAIMSRRRCINYPQK